MAIEKELCQSGELLAQRFKLGIANVQEDINGLKILCAIISETVQNIDKGMARHLGEHKGTEQCVLKAGRKYGIIFGMIGASVGCILASGVLYEILTKIMTKVVQ